MQKNYLLLCCTSVFPQLIAGPIVRYQTVERRWPPAARTGTISPGGLRRFVTGLAKSAHRQQRGPGGHDNLRRKHRRPRHRRLLGIAGLHLQIYFDFSGYSDMAIGMGRMFSFHFRNFDYPYISKSITEFWRRWHISPVHLVPGTNYIPLGGNRKNGAADTEHHHRVGPHGIWHGAAWNFHGVGRVLRRSAAGKIRVRQIS